ncbi:DoxX family protein [Streptomyces sp. x-19]|uniref:DoxX family protein n=1 Tax=Streptomyces sp. x-19 TaxID=2789280 RepID=UPI00397EDCBF
MNDSHAPSTPPPPTSFHTQRRSLQRRSAPRYSAPTGCLSRPGTPWLGALKGAGAAGLLVGLLGFRPLGVAAAVGLVLFFVGAVVAHVRARAYATMAAPAGYLGLAVASLALTVLRQGGA